MFRKWSLLTGLAGAAVLAPWAAAQSQPTQDAQAAKSQAQTQASAQQQEPSLADAARQARQNKDKNAAPTKKVFTDEDVLSTHSDSSSMTGLGSGHSSSTNSAGHSASKASASSDDKTPMGQAWAGIGRAEDSLDQLAPLDRGSLARVVLEGNDVDFPGRRAWEERLYIAKETYVAQSRQLVEEMKSVMENAQSFKDSDGAAKDGSNSPQAQQLVARTQRLLQQAQTTEASFKAVMQEGVDQAKLASRH